MVCLVTKSSYTQDEDFRWDVMPNWY
jgi:hypothetical protein